MTWRGTAAVAVLLLTGCSLFSRSKPKFYSLAVVAPPDAVAVAGTPLAIGSLELPPDIDRREVAVRKDDQQLDVRGSELWSAPLHSLVLHTLVFDLAARLPEGMIILPGTAQTATPARSIDVIIEDYAAGPQSRVVLNARWIMGEVTHREQIATDVDSLDSASIAAGMSQALAMLADRIVAGMQRSGGH